MYYCVLLGLTGTFTAAAGWLFLPAGLTLVTFLSYPVILLKLINSSI